MSTGRFSARPLIMIQTAILIQDVTVVAENPTVRDTAKMAADMETRHNKDPNPCITCPDNPTGRFSARALTMIQVAILILNIKVVAENRLA